MNVSAENRIMEDRFQEWPDRVEAGPSAAERKERMSRLRETRKARQLGLGIFFILLLGAGWFLPLLGYFIPLCMAAGMGIAAFRGREWCDWYCPRGSFADSLMKAVSPSRRIPDVIKGAGLRTAVVAVLMAVLSFQIIRLWPDFYAIGGFFMILLTVTTGAGLLLGLIFHERTWCYICPIGSISHLIGRNKRPLALSQENCNRCTACAKACPMQLTPYERNGGEMSLKGDCIKCGLCVASCPRGALRF